MLDPCCFSEILHLLSSTSVWGISFHIEGESEAADNSPK